MTNPSPKELIQVGQIEIRFLLEGAETNGALAMFECVIGPGARVPVPHRHLTYDETVYGLAGVVTFTVEGRPVDVRAGDTLFIPRGAVHGFVNSGADTVKFVAVVTPGVLGPEFFREMATALRQPGPPDPGILGEIMRRHGLEPVAPAPNLAASPAQK
jgi:quercetin dioxygenase-like cupin family protein